MSPSEQETTSQVAPGAATPGVAAGAATTRVAHGAATPPRAGDGRTVVHLVRHGQVYNPNGTLYGRLPGYHLSLAGQQMADVVAAVLADRDLAELRCSPLERARETIAPLAASRDLPVVIDDRVIEAGNNLQGQRLRFPQSLASLRNLWLIRNPLRPSWGESYRQIVARMRAVLADAAEAAAGREAVIVSHQLPIWMARCDVEGRRLVHDPRNRECSVASITSITLIDGHPTSVSYCEPAADLVTAAGKNVAGA